MSINNNTLQRRMFMNYLSADCGPGSAADIATGYGLNGPGFESRWGRNFSCTSTLALGPTQPPEQWVPGLSRG
jgi:hypothetical protein